jgi:acetyl-CoA carboxylase biotin carboxyl carrier protein
MAAKKKSKKTSTTSAAKRAKKAKKTPAARSGARRSPRRSAAEAAADERVHAIQRVIDVMVAAGAVEVELEEAGRRLRVRLKEEQQVVSYAAPPVAGALPPAAMSGASAPAAEAPGAAVEDPHRQVFASPMVGTFYRAASPDAEPFVELGDHVSPDSTVCILEAMKVMNEIKAELSGEVVEILAQNGEPVEFGQPLFVIRVD